MAILREITVLVKMGLLCGGNRLFSALLQLLKPHSLSSLDQGCLHISKEDKVVTPASKFWTRGNASHSLFCWFKASFSANSNSYIV